MLLFVATEIGRLCHAEISKKPTLQIKVALIRQLNVTNYDNTPLQYTANLMAVKGSFKSNLFCFVFHLTRVY